MTRKKVFGNAKKKEQLQAKREKKRQKNQQEWDWNEKEYKPLPKNQNDNNASSTNNNNNMTSAISDNKSKLRTLFEKEPQEVIDKRIKESQQPLKRTSTNNPENLVGEVHYTSIDMPVRPKWDRSMSTQAIEKQEDDYFKKYLDTLYKKFSKSRLNYFEHNLNVWRQLWRVVELSDICMLVADIRHPLFHFPQSLYRYVTQEHQKPLILLLNKCDLVGEEQTNRWIEYFSKNYPLLKVVAFSTYTSAVHDEKEKKTRRRKKQVDYNLVYKIWSACKDITLPNKDNNPNFYKELIKQAEERMDKCISDDEESDDEEIQDELVTKQNQQKLIEELERTAETTITIGLIGHPNTGKSCVLNGLVGRTVVSASYTPGHTKHFQTYFVSKHVRLCDSPGLVFPAIDMPKSLQVLCGIFPIAQVREPYSAIQYLAERVPVEKIYNLQLPKEEGHDEWSAWAVCVAYAIKRGYYTTKMSRPDVYRAANEILRETLYGFPVLLAFNPPAGRLEERRLEDFMTIEPDSEDVQISIQDSSAKLQTKELEYEDIYDEEEEEEEEEESEEEEEDDGESSPATGNTNPFSLLAEE